MLVMMRMPMLMFVIMCRMMVMSLFSNLKPRMNAILLTRWTDGPSLLKPGALGMSLAAQPLQPGRELTVAARGNDLEGRRAGQLA